MTVEGPRENEAPLAGRVRAVCLGQGGIPKREVPEAEITRTGLAGDRQRAKCHGGENRAVCLFFDLDAESLALDGVDGDAAGVFGENLRIEGLDPHRLRPGDRLRVGNRVRIEIHDVREPCATLKSVDRRFPELMIGRSGFVCRVLQPGRVCAGDPIEVEHN